MPLALLSLAGGAVAARCGSDEEQPSSPRSYADETLPKSVEPMRIVQRRQVVSWVDAGRQVQYADGSVAKRRLTTVVRYPKVLGGTPAERARRFPLVVFAHGYDLTPGAYRPLLRAWARAGYVVAAPVLPGESAIAPGGPNRADLVNEPADLRFVVDRLLGRSALAAVIDPQRVAVAGHSDGGSAALAVAYDARHRDRRIDATIVLAGSDIPGEAPFAFPADGPPLLAVQGDADSVNPPAATNAFYDRAAVPRFMLTVLRGGHYDPYMTPGPHLDAVSRTSIAFLDRSLRDAPISNEELVRSGTRRGLSTLTAG